MALRVRTQAKVISAQPRSTVSRHPGLLESRHFVHHAQLSRSERMSRVIFPAIMALIAAGLVASGSALGAQPVNTKSARAQSVSAKSARARSARVPSTTGLTGHDQLHQQARVAGKICMTEHEHGGEGALASRRGAEAAAIRHWESFTAWEYGKPWGRYSLAAGKNMECTNGGAVWLCNTRARPCRSARR
jgi:hypothetical protein